MYDYQRDCRERGWDEGSQNVQTFNYKTNTRDILQNMADIIGTEICYM